MCYNSHTYDYIMWCDRLWRYTAMNDLLQMYNEPITNITNSFIFNSRPLIHRYPDYLLLILSLESTVLRVKALIIALKCWLYCWSVYYFTNPLFAWSTDLIINCLLKQTYLTRARFDPTPYFTWHQWYPWGHWGSWIKPFGNHYPTFPDSSWLATTALTTTRQ